MKIFCKKCGNEKSYTIKYFHKNGKYLRRICKVCCSKYDKSYYQDNKETYKENHKRYNKRNKKKILSRQRKYKQICYQTNPLYKILDCLRAGVKQAIKNKSTRTVDLIGCSIPELKKHLETQFQPGMTWKNHSKFGWHIDHIIPCAKFDLSRKDEQRKCFHYTNLQPLWWRDNIRKGKK